MCDLQNWLLISPKWITKHRNVIKTKKCNKKDVKLKEILENSDNFSIPFPIDTIRTVMLLKTVPKSVLKRNAQSVYPIIHEAALHLCADFILSKLEHGSEIEKKIYKDMTVLDFIQRLLIKRAICFIGNKDYYVLRDGTHGQAFDKWIEVGTDSEKTPFLLKDYLSYDELKLSALLSVSSYSYFVNDGRRYNGGSVEENRDLIEPEGIIIGLIGIRLGKPNVMERQEIILKENEKPSHTLNLFLNFYQEQTFSYNDVKDGLINDELQALRYTKTISDAYFDNAVYTKRLAVSFDTLLFEANHRAEERKKYGYVHVVGIGLGVWKASDHQEEMFLKSFGNRIQTLGKKINFISDIDFSYFSTNANCLGFVDGNMFPIEGHPLGGIKIHISARQPFSKLPTDDKLLVVSYAWDSNAHPGNEFWDGSPGTSSDSATAASCQVAELHNAYINPALCAENLMVVTSNGLVGAQEYLHDVLKNLNDD